MGKHEESLSSPGLIIEDCKRMMSSLSDVKLCFVKCSADTVAHKLARASVTYAEKMTWDNMALGFIIELLFADAYN